VIAAPKDHKILLENENVRVLEVTVLPGEIEPVHHHRWLGVKELSLPELRIEIELEVHKTN
jgi:hypothetical protein